MAKKQGGRAGRPAREQVKLGDWEKLEAGQAFKDLLAAKARFIVPATVFFLVYYFSLPLLVGYAPDLMQTRVLGVLNLAYVFALSQFAMAWIVAALYVRAAGRFDRMAGDVVAGHPSSKGGK